MMMMMGDRVKASRSSHDHHEEPLSPSARFFHVPCFNVYIIAMMGCKTRINPDVIKAGLQQTLVKHPRFSSKIMVRINVLYIPIISSLLFNLLLHGISPLHAAWSKTWFI